MKRKICAVLVIMMILVSATGCNNEKLPAEQKNEKTKTDENKSGENLTESQKDVVDYDSIYSPVLEEYYYMIKYANNQTEVNDGFMGVVEAAQAFEDEALNEIGYLISDINDDGVKELLVGISEDEYVKNDLYALYTVVNNYPHLVLEGRSRSWHSLMDGGKIFGFGSNGAAYRIFGEYSLGDKGELKCKDFYFSYDKDGSYTNIGFFHNTTGIYDMAMADELNISQEEFGGKEEAYAERTVKIDFTPFSAFVPSGDGAEIFNADHTNDPVFMTIKGNWRAFAENEGIDWVLDLDLYSDGSAAYKVGYPESEYVVYYRGRWNPSSGTTATTLDLVDDYGSGPFNGEFVWNVKNDTLTLMHKSGDPLLYGMEETSLTFDIKR